MKKALTAVAAASVLAFSAQAADWSDTSIAYSTGSAFKEPFVANGGNVGKQIYSLKNVSGDKYGSNFFNADLLQSNSVDGNAQEAYIVYRRLFDFGKINKTDYKFGPVKDMGLTLGYDWNTKNDTGYGSRKRMFSIGPTFMIDVPAGFLNASVLVLSESNQPAAYTGTAYSSRYSYKTHPDFNLVWGIPIASTKLEFEGYADFIASKGSLEPNAYGQSQSAAETHINANLMYDISEAVGAAKNTFKLGAGYEYWKNKFGNNSANVQGAFAKTPYLKAEYHF
jgi:nucleoside-specific outer membrane channel protein Tsx